MTQFSNALLSIFYDAGKNIVGKEKTFKLLPPLPSSQSKAHHSFSYKLKKTIVARLATGIFLYVQFQNRGGQLFLSRGPHWQHIWFTRGSISPKFSLKLEENNFFLFTFLKKIYMTQQTKYPYREPKKCSQATLRCLAGRMWPAGRTLSRTVIELNSNFLYSGYTLRFWDSKIVAFIDQWPLFKDNP